MALYSYKDLIGKNIKFEDKVVGKIKEVLLHPDSFDVIAFNISFFKNLRDTYSPNYRNEFFAGRMFIKGISDKFLESYGYNLDEQEQILLGHTILGKTVLNSLVVTENNIRLGKVANYFIDDIYFKISHFIVKPGLFPFLSKQELYIDRNDIVKVEHKKIIVKDRTIAEYSFTKYAGALN